MGKNAERKPKLTVDAGIQTESSKRFRLDSSDNDRKIITCSRKTLRV